MNFFEYFNIGYILTNIFLTYSIIKIIDYINGIKKVPTIIKRICLIISIIITTSVYYYIVKYEDLAILFNSAVATPVVWSWILKPICSKLNIDYRKIDETIL